MDVQFRLEALRQLYDTAKNLLKLEAEGADNGAVEEIRGELNQTYDRFVAGFGPIGSKSNARLLAGNPAFTFLRALEGRSDGWKTEKAPLFSRRTVRPRWQKREVLSAQDALFVVLDTLGRADIDQIAALLGVPPEQVIRDLRGLVYQQPDGQWLTADQYLSGNIRAKLCRPPRHGPNSSRPSKRTSSALRRPCRRNPNPVRSRPVWVPAGSRMKTWRHSSRTDPTLPSRKRGSCLPWAAGPWRSAPVLRPLRHLRICAPSGGPAG